MDSPEVNTEMQCANHKCGTRVSPQWRVILEVGEEEDRFCNACYMRFVKARTARGSVSEIPASRRVRPATGGSAAAAALPPQRKYKRKRGAAKKSVARKNSCQILTGARACRGVPAAAAEVTRGDAAPRGVRGSDGFDAAPRGAPLPAPAVPSVEELTAYLWSPSFGWV